MKKLLPMAALLAVVFTPVVAQADTVTVGEVLGVSGGFNTGGGSTFQIKESEGNIFASFCLELNENIGTGNYTVEGVSKTAYLGGVGPAGDPISYATAWLYRQFRSGNITYTSNAFAVQQAIWVLEQELTSCPAGSCSQFVSDATANGTAADLARVNVINFGPEPGETSPKVQDLLTTVPDGGATLMLLGGALMGLGALRRKFRG